MFEKEGTWLSLQLGESGKEKILQGMEDIEMTCLDVTVALRKASREVSALSVEPPFYSKSATGENGGGAARRLGA